MRTTLLLIFIAQVLVLCLQFVTSFAQFTPQWIPYHIELTDKDLIRQQNDNFQKLQAIQDLKNNTLERFNSMRNRQLKKLETTKQAYSGARLDKTKHNRFTGPDSIEHALSASLRCYVYFDYQIGLLWFDTQIGIPIWFRVMMWVPILLLPIFLISHLKRLASKPRNEFQKFLASHKKQPKVAFLMWRNQSIEAQFKLEDRKVKLEWFHSLIKIKEMDEALRWGTYLLNNDRDDLKFRRSFCEKILLSMNIHDLKYSWIFNWYLQNTKDKNVAETLWEKAFRDSKIEKIEKVVLALVKTINQILHKDEISEFITHHEVILDGPDGDSSLEQ